MTSATSRMLTIAAAGDAMVTRRLSTIEDDRFRTLRRILTDADASVVNLEGPLCDSGPHPIAGTRTHLRSPPWAADELAWMGFDLFSATNNHIGDYAQPGMTATIEALEARGIAYAGIGENAAEARSPAYVDTPAGRVALLAVTTTYAPGTQAAHQRRDAPGRSGISTLRLHPRYVVTEEHMNALRELHDALAVDELIADRNRYVDHPESDDVVPLLAVGAGAAGRTLLFEAGEKNGIRFEAHPDDVAEVHEAIRIASGNADAVVLSVHSHEGSNGTYNDPSVPQVLETFARGCIDVGVDAFFCHGAHRLRGLELYGGAPVFYGLGNFALHFDSVPFFPTETYETHGVDREGSPREIQASLGAAVSRDHQKQSIVPVCTFEAGSLREVRLYPVELGYDRITTGVGTAYLAEGGIAADVLDRLSTLSKPYGTRIDIEDGRGVVAL